MEQPVLFAVLLTAVSTYTLACGLQAADGILRSRINGVLILICSLLLAWSLCLAITASTPVEEIRRMTHLLAPLTWAFIPGLLVHFTLLLTEKETLLSRWWLYPLLYLPGLLTIFIFTLLPFLGLNADTFTLTPFGWAKFPRFEIWDLFFYAYLILFTLIDLIVLLVSRHQTGDQGHRAQMLLTAGMVFLTASVWGLSDLLTKRLDVPLPYPTPVIFLFFTFAILYSTHYHRPIHRRDIPRAPIILTERMQRKVYLLMSLVFFLAGLIHVLSRFILGGTKEVLSSGMLSLFLLAIAAAILLIRQISIEQNGKDLLILAAFSLSVPVVGITSASMGSITLWIFMLPVIIICLLYNRRTLLVTITTASFLTQILVWAVLPGIAEGVNLSDIFVRLSFIAVSGFLAVYVSSVYMDRLKSNDAHDRKRKLLMELSQELISADEQNMDRKIDWLLGRCGSFLGCDRAYFILMEERSDGISYSREWLRPEKSIQLKDLYYHDPESFPRTIQLLEKEKVTRLHDARELSYKARELKELLADQNIHGLIHLPVSGDDRTLGFLGFHSSRPLREWEMYLDDYLDIIGGLLSDVITRIHRERRIRYLAYHDQLTGLPNRLLFKDRLQQAIHLAQRNNRTVGVVFIDLDSFKSVNDSMGHDLGDQLLIQVAEILSSHVRSYDAVSRIGGDEFVLMINQLPSPEDLKGIMDKLMEGLRKPFMLQSQELFITASAGVAFYPQDGEQSETLIKNADTAMYRAKEMGRNQYQICSQDMKDQIIEKMELTNYLYRALEKNQFFIHYQPQVSMATRKIVGAEALIRWNLPQVGIIYPDVFIPLAEQTRLIESIGEWVLESACTQSRKWVEKGLPPLRMAVNVSVHQLLDPGFVQQVARIVNKTGINPADLEIEITESATSKNPTTVSEVLTGLKKIGVSLSIDDFGTEYSSLSRLKYLPIDRVKIDMQFVQGIEDNEKDKAIAEVIVTLAKSMNMKVIAEGVETDQQLDFLNNLQCDEIQGYYFYRPMAPEDLETLL